MDWEMGRGAVLGWEGYMRVGMIGPISGFSEFQIYTHGDMGGLLGLTRKGGGRRICSLVSPVGLE